MLTEKRRGRKKNCQWQRKIRWCHKIYLVLQTVINTLVWTSWLWIILFLYPINVSINDRPNENALFRSASRRFWYLRVYFWANNFRYCFYDLANDSEIKIALLVAAEPYLKYTYMHAHNLQGSIFIKEPFSNSMQNCTTDWIYTIYVAYTLHKRSSNGESSNELLWIKWSAQSTEL